MRWRNSILFTTLLGVGVFMGMLLSAESSVHSESPVAPQVAYAQPSSNPVARPARSGNNAARDLSQSFQWVAAQTTPSVVTIRSEQTVRSRRNELEGVLPRDFFHRRRGESEPDLRRKGHGSGVIVREDGYIVTNNHVVENADKLTVLLGEDAEEVEATIVGRDPWTDIAVIKVDRKGLPAIRMGDSEQLHVGHWVLAIGSPFLDTRLQHTVTAGIVSALNRSIGIIQQQVENYGAFENFIQTDAAINPGNSGGALVNMDGALIGINTAISSTNGSNAGIGFAIPANMVQQVMNQLIENGRVRRGYLGVAIEPVTGEMRDALGLPNTRGAFVKDVVDDTPASRAGLHGGDVIRSIDGQEIRTLHELRYKIASTPPEGALTLGVWRKDRLIEKQVELQELPAEFRQEEPSEIAKAEEVSGTPTRVGASVRVLNEQLAEQSGYEGRQGVLVTDIERRSEAAERGLRVGDLIEEVNMDPVKSVEDFTEILDEADSGSAVLLLVRRGESSQYLGVRIPKE
jgi:serine protease Do